MGKNSVAEALRALADSESRSKTARLRDVFTEVEAALAAGVSRSAILQTLHEQGFTMTMKSFEGTVYRLRKQARTGKAVKPYAERAHDSLSSAEAESRAAAPQGLTPKNNPLTAKPSATNQGAPAPRRPGEPEKFVWDVDKNETPEW